MIPVLGHFALVLAFAMAILQSILPFKWQSTAKPLVLGQGLFLLLSFIALFYSFVSNDFSVAYVAKNSNTQLPLMYRISAIWGAHEGSLLLWALILAAWSVVITFYQQTLPKDMLARIVAVLGMVSAGFLLFLLATSDPFIRLTEIPQEGQDLNPLLQDPGLASHPPMLYIGYVGLAVPFAFALAVLMAGKFEASWVRWVRTWTIMAWCFLTLGITLGSWWAYRELGWGGWWFWDPVENASFLPWLASTALIHSLIVTEKRGAFQTWTLLLAITAFSLSLMGTFLVRSGILVSVHSFVNDPARGLFMLKFLLVVIGVSLLLYAWRGHRLKSHPEFQLVSREGFLLFNNVILISSVATILLGTLYPLILDVFDLGKISVGPPYFNLVFIPFVFLLLFFMGIGPHCAWQQMDMRLLTQRLRYTLFLSIIVGIFFPLWMERSFKPMVMLAMMLVSWVVASTCQMISTRLSLKHYGMITAHLGMAVCVMGIALSSAYSTERDVRMVMGEKVQLGKYIFQFQGIRELKGPNYQAISGDFLVFHKDKKITELHAEKRFYTAREMIMTKAAIDPGIFRDLYIALGEPLDKTAWSVRLYYKPFIRWIWAGGFLMMLGGGLAIIGRRRS